MNTEQPKYVTVYGASSDAVDDIYKADARQVGRLLAQRGIVTVNGGGACGLMGATTDGAMDAGGRTLGIIPRFMTERGWGYDRLTEVRVTEGMRDRKKMLADIAVGVIALPGGTGTFDELFEMITRRQLGLYKGQVVILNTNGYYDIMLAMLQNAYRQGFMRKDTDMKLFKVATTPEMAVEMVLADAAE